MAEFIDREAALQFVFDACAECMDACVEFDGIYADCNQCMLERVKLKLRDLPAADVRPVVKAYWIGEGDGYADGEMVYDVWHCSNCDYTVDEGDNEPPQYNFCPNCGADMREES